MSSKKRTKRNRAGDEYKVKFSTLSLINPVLLYRAFVSLFPEGAVPLGQPFPSVPSPSAQTSVRKLRPVFAG